jgi:hypothetical protein
MVRHGIIDDSCADKELHAHPHMTDQVINCQTIGDMDRNSIPWF